MAKEHTIKINVDDGDRKGEGSKAEDKKTSSKKKAASTAAKKKTVAKDVSDKGGLKSAPQSGNTGKKGLAKSKSTRDVSVSVKNKKNKNVSGVSAGRGATGIKVIDGDREDVARKTAESGTKKRTAKTDGGSGSSESAQARDNAVSGIEEQTSEKGSVEGAALSFRKKIEEALNEVSDNEGADPAGGEPNANGGAGNSNGYEEAAEDVEKLEKENSSVKEVINLALQQEKTEDTQSKKEEKKGSLKKRKHSIGLYRRIALFFFILTIVLVGLVFYFSFAGVTITLVPNQTRTSNNLLFDVVDDGKQLNDSYSIDGLVKTLDIQNTKTYKSSGQEVIGQEVVGQVTIINNYSKNQPLVAMTRLLSPEGYLYRIDETVNVPAGGEVTVDIYADEPSRDVVVDRTRFTIPGLWAGLQDKIYATSEEGTEYKQKTQAYISKEDVDNAIRDLKQGMLARAKQEIGPGSESAKEVLYKIDDNSVDYEVDGEIGEEAEEFTVSMSVEVKVVVFSEDEAIKLAEQKLKSALDKDRKLLELDNDSVMYSLDNYNEKNGVATVNSVFEGRVTLAENSDVVDVDKILGLNENQLNAYLGGLEGIAGYKVEYYPSFIKRVPHLADRIEVNIE